jgi:NAD-dependent deacetylase
MSSSHVPDGLAERVASARHVMVLTGAGVSAESGVPTFREAQTGLWSRFRPEELATPEAFLEDPETVWAWYEWRRDLVAAAKPNPGHLALAELEQRLQRLTLVTQNVDGLHRRAGSADPVEFHGNLFENRCFDCSRPAHDVPRPCPVPPRCRDCGGRLRPGVVWFGEPIPVEALQRAFAAVEDCDLFLSVGTSALVYPAAGLAEQAAARGATLVEVNPVPTGLARRADYVWAAASGEALPALLAALRRGPGAPGGQP